jgi:hypothetical protein
MGLVGLSEVTSQPECHRGGHVDETAGSDYPPRAFLRASSTVVTASAPIVGTFLS